MTDIVRQLEEKLAQRADEKEELGVQIRLAPRAGILSAAIDENSEALKQIIEKHARESLRPQVGATRESPRHPNAAGMTRVTITDQNCKPVHLRGATSAVAHVRSLASRSIANMIDKQILCDFVDRDQGIIQFKMPPEINPSEPVDIEFTIQGPDRVIQVRKGSQ